MIDRPGVDEPLLAAEVAAAWALSVADLVFLPVGLDGNAWAYRVDTTGGARYFLKLRRGEFTGAAVALPGFLRARGLRQVVAPLAPPGGSAAPYTASRATGCCSTRSRRAAVCGLAV